MQKIIIHADYGSGFGTSMGVQTDRKAVVTDKILIEALEARPALGAALRQKLDIEIRNRIYFWTGDKFLRDLMLLDKLNVVEVPDGIRWRIIEYDGWESVEREDQIHWW